MPALTPVAVPPSIPPLVLIVDDAKDNSEMYATFLSHAGFRVKQAGDADDAWAQFLREPPEIVVTDLALPGSNGVELCRRMRACRSHQETSIIALTGLLLRQQDIERVIDAGSDAVLFKPCLPETLLARIREMRMQSAKLRETARETRARAQTIVQKSIHLQDRAARLQGEVRKRQARKIT